MSVPTKSAAVARLREIHRQHQDAGRTEEARSAQSDLALIEKAAGEDLYEMVREAQDTAFRLERSALYKDAENYWPAGPLTFGLALSGMAAGGALGYAAASLFQLEPALLAVPLALAGSSAMFLPMSVQSKAQNARQVVEAVDRRYLEVQS